MNTIKKINKIGKVGKIITIIMLCLTIASFVGNVIATVVFGLIPNDFFELTVNNQVDMTIDMTALGEGFDEEDMSPIEDALKDGQGTMNINGVTVSDEFEFVDVQANDGVITASSTVLPSTMRFRNITVVMVLFDIVNLAAIVSLVFVKNLCAAFEKCETPFEDNVIKKMRNFAYSLIPWAVLSSLPQMAANNIFSNQIRLGFDVNFGIIAVVVVIIGLTYIFKYGAVLQQEHDETL